MKYIIGIIIILIVTGFVVKARASFIDGQSVNIRIVNQLPIEAKWADGQSALQFKVVPANNSFTGSGTFM